MAKRKKKKTSHLLKIMKQKEKNLYETTLDDCVQWFRIINREMFDGILSDDVVFDIRWRRKSQAYYQCGGSWIVPRINMNKKYKSKQFFVEVLAHEMVHHYQYHTDKPLNHGRLFKEWCDRFKSKKMVL